MDEIGLDAVPEGDWFCSACCGAKSSKSATSKAQKKTSSKARGAAKTAAPAPVETHNRKRRA